MYTCSSLSRPRNLSVDLVRRNFALGSSHFPKRASAAAQKRKAQAAQSRANLMKAAAPATAAAPGAAVSATNAPSAAALMARKAAGGERSVRLPPADAPSGSGPSELTKFARWRLKFKRLVTSMRWEIGMLVVVILYFVVVFATFALEDQAVRAPPCSHPLLRHRGRALTPVGLSSAGQTVLTRVASPRVGALVLPRRLRGSSVVSG